MKTFTKFALLVLLFQNCIQAADISAAGWWSDTYKAGHKPEMDVTGRYRVVDKSIRQGDVPEIRAGVVYRYGTAFKGKVDGKHYWMVPVRYYKYAPSASIYTQARILAEAYACVSHDRVEMWVPKYIRRFGL